MSTPIPQTAAVVLAIENSWVERWNAAAAGEHPAASVITVTRQMEGEVDAALTRLGWADAESFEAALEGYVEERHHDVRVEGSYSESLALAAGDATP